MHTWTAVTHCCLTALTAFPGVFRLYKTLQHDLILELDGVTTHQARLEATSAAASATS